MFLRDRLRSDRPDAAKALEGVDNVYVLRERAKRRLPRMAFEFIEGGADDEVTVRANREAFSAYALRPRMATYVDRPQIGTTLFGQNISMPILTAPCGMLRIIHPDAEPGVARAAASVGTISIVSAMSGTSLDDTAAAVGDHDKPWFQLYALGGRRGVDWLVDRAQAAGYRALVVTVDTQVPGNRERDIRNRVPQPLRIDLKTALSLGPELVRRPRWLARFLQDGMPVDLPNVPELDIEGSRLTQSQATVLMAKELPEWHDLEQIRSRWSGPLLIKGILTAEDAQRSVDVGANGMIVSNHGGRQLDSVPATLDVLPEIVSAVNGRAEVLVDGGIRRGTDVLKALALGARAVVIGRPYVWGLAAAGESGVAAVLRVLRNELIRDMRLMGCRSIHDLDHTWIRSSRSAERRE
jgi:isopentenyl diphosphate isomerase/L-lactate dehydrogenase-like FMN-dependent dehydrogenase